MKAEDWLYEDGEDSTKAKYIAKYEELASIGNVIKGRYLAKEQEKRNNIDKSKKLLKLLLWLKNGCSKRSFQNKNLLLQERTIKILKAMLIWIKFN